MALGLGLFLGVEWTVLAHKHRAFDDHVADRVVGPPATSSRADILLALDPEFTLSDPASETSAAASWPDRRGRPDWKPSAVARDGQAHPGFFISDQARRAKAPPAAIPAQKTQYGPALRTAFMKAP